MLKNVKSSILLEFVLYICFVKFEENRKKKLFHVSNPIVNIDEINKPSINEFRNSILGEPYNKNNENNR